MLRTQSTSPARNRSLKRRQHQRPPYNFGSSSTFSSAVPSLDGEKATLDLSLHLPSKPYSNRFEALGSPGLRTPPARDFRVLSHRRNLRNSKRSKEAKRRRDARRPRKKRAAQMLDEQLSRDIDMTLANVSPFPQHIQTVPSPTPVLPTISFVLPKPSHLPPTPPQLPPLDFPSLNINVLSDLARSFRTPTPPTTPPLMSSLPSWCPALPCLMRNGMWSNGLPLFHDLSSLPEPQEPPRPEPSIRQELQLWRGSLDWKPRKQSRFFPSPLQPPKPRVKLPCTACNLHQPDAPIEDLSAPEPQDAGYESGTAGNLSALETALQAAEVAIGPRRPTPVVEPSAANLWHIIHSEHKPANDHSNDAYTASFKMVSDEDPAMAAFEPPQLSDNHSSCAAELDGRELPYVHANALLGYPNEIGKSPYADEHLAIRDSGIFMTAVPEPPFSLNETVVDDEIMDHSYSAFDPSQQKERSETPLPRYRDSSTNTMAEILPIDCVGDDAGIYTHSTSDAHFQSEQELFKLSSDPTTSPEQSIIDIAAFLELGHVKNCWCRDCDDAPELVEDDKPDGERFMDAADGWTMYSASQDSETDASNTGEVFAEVVVEEEAEAEIHCRTAWDWDDLFPYQPQPLWETVVMKSEDVDEVETDWEWECNPGSEVTPGI